MSSQQQAEFKELFLSEGEDKARLTAIQGGLRNSSIRSVAWRYFLGCLPPADKMSSWTAHLQEKREKYQALVQEHCIDPNKAGQELDPTFNNPLTQDENSPWAQFFENTELEKEIIKDLERLFPEYEFFSTDRVQELMKRILFIWAKCNEAVSYRQGMHELLAPMVYVMEKDCNIPAANKEAGGDKVLELLLDPDTMEADLYNMFEQLMAVVAPWFEVGPRPQKKKIPVGSLGSSDLEGGNDVKEYKSPLVIKCHHIHHKLLKEYDPPVYKSLEALGIEPQLYALKWFRLLFGREFHLDDVCMLWDAILADSQQFGLVDYIALSMLIYIRGQLLNQDYSMVMRRLMKYPPVEDVHLFVEKALQLRRWKPGERPQNQGIPTVTPQESGQPVANVVHNPQVTQVVGSKSTNPFAPSTPQPVAQRPVQPSPGITSPGLISSARPVVARGPMPSGGPGAEQQAIAQAHQAQQELLDCRMKQKQLAQRLSQIAATLQAQLVTEEANGFNEDTVLVALAELKVVEDVLAGRMVDVPPEILSKSVPSPAKPQTTPQTVLQATMSPQATPQAAPPPQATPSPQAAMPPQRPPQAAMPPQMPPQATMPPQAAMPPQMPPQAIMPPQVGMPPQMAPAVPPPTEAPKKPKSNGLFDDDSVTSIFDDFKAAPKAPKATTPSAPTLNAADIFADFKPSTSKTKKPPAVDAKDPLGALLGD